MRSLTVRGVPEELHEELKRRAERNRRSLNGEVLVLLERAMELVPDGATVMERLRDKEREARAARPEPVRNAAAPDREAVLDRMRNFRETLREMGVSRIGLFGSLARGEGRADSDVDLLVEFDPSRKNFEAFYRLSCFLEELLGRDVELVTTEGLSPHLGPGIREETEFVEVGG